MWLQGIERRNGVLAAKMVKGDSDTEWMNVEATWEAAIPGASTSRMSGATCFSRWKVVDATEYFSEMAIKANPDANRHQIFEVDHNGLRLVLPAILVLKALFKPNATVFEYLFRPSGLDMLLAPVSANGSMSVALLPRKLRQHVPVGDTSFERLRWLYCFPSARAAFDSVYTSATSGIVGIKLPTAEIDICLKGCLRGRKFFVSGLNIAKCVPLEAPFDWAGRQPQHFRLREPAPGERLNPILADPDIIEGPAGWELSDDEWACVAYLFPTGPRCRSGEQARAFVGAILEKLGTGVGWTSVNSKHGTISAVSSLYRDYRQSGKWHELVATIIEMRKQKSTVARAA
ncbi:transposase [Paraburkholderia bannensis]|uniref:Transposase of IS4/5 family n=2 Tax=Paraburkholderia tropica TaxID=92647 RepID=A0AAQ1GDA3_9BURK|nr:MULTISPECIES: transposase [Paraburkholderia]RQM50957.1 transposase [Paraburkholderia bannensis]RQN40313.1 transposase [Paraburkholderia tropica]SEJ33584.1 Putative transposase of IS4/5 family [Paraburkholderia tropica]